MDINKNNPLYKKLSGFQKANRDRFFLITLGQLELEEFVLYELCIAITDWDARHFETSGTFKTTNKNLAQILQWKADSTVSRYMRSLIQKGFIEPVGDRFRVKDFDKWVYRKKTAGMQYRDAEKQMENADKQDISAEMQDIPF